MSALAESIERWWKPVTAFLATLGSLALWVLRLGTRVDALEKSHEQTQLAMREGEKKFEVLSDKISNNMDETSLRLNKIAVDVGFMKGKMEDHNHNVG